MEKSRGIVVILTILFISAFLYNLRGEEGALELQLIPKSARAVSIGGCDGVSAYSSTMFFNPASIGLINKFGTELMYTNIFQISDYGVFSAAYRLPGKGGVVVGLGYDRHQVDEILPFDSLNGDLAARLRNPSIRADGYSDGNSFDVVDESFRFVLVKNFRGEFSRAFAYSYKIPINLSVGVSYFIYRQSQMLSMIKSDQINYYLGGNKDLVGYASGLDAGFYINFIVKYHPVTFKAEREIGFGGSLQNMLKSRVKWQTIPEYFENTFSNRRLFLSYYEKIEFIQGGLKGTLGMSTLYGEDYSGGIEYDYKNKLYMRGGWKNSSFMFGMGIHLYKGIYFDYAFSKESLSVTPYWISFGVRF